MTAHQVADAIFDLGAIGKHVTSLFLSDERMVGCSDCEIIA
jgi:hypothetical protein